jgi:hypothetical protein
MSPRRSALPAGAGHTDRRARGLPRRLPDHRGQGPARPGGALSYRHTHGVLGRAWRAAENWAGSRADAPRRGRARHARGCGRWREKREATRQEQIDHQVEDFATVLPSTAPGKVRRIQQAPLSVRQHGPEPTQGVGRYARAQRRDVPLEVGTNEVLSPDGAALIALRQEVPRESSPDSEARLLAAADLANVERRQLKVRDPSRQALARLAPGNSAGRRFSGTAPRGACTSAGDGPTGARSKSGSAAATSLGGEALIRARARRRLPSSQPTSRYGEARLTQPRRGSNALQCVSPIGGQLG